MMANPSGSAEKRSSTQESDNKGIGVGYQYVIVYEKQIWPYARNACKNRGGDLASITSIETFKRIVEFLRKEYPGESQFWVGAEKHASGTWKWLSGPDPEIILPW